MESLKGGPNTWYSQLNRGILTRLIKYSIGQIVILTTLHRAVKQMKKTHVFDCEKAPPFRVSRILNCPPSRPDLGSCDRFFFRRFWSSLLGLSTHNPSCQLRILKKSRRHDNAYHCLPSYHNSSDWLDCRHFVSMTTRQIIIRAKFVLPIRDRSNGLSYQFVSKWRTGRSLMSLPLVCHSLSRD